MTSDETTPKHPLADKAAELPANPGVYLMKDVLGAVIYVGKARLFKHRAPGTVNSAGPSV